MQFRTEIKPDHYTPSIEHSDGIMTVGSCFADNISEQLKYYRFNILPNPFGVLYNPASIYYSLKLLSKNILFSENDLIQFNEIWHSFYHHGSFSGLDKKKVLSRINNQLEKSREFLKNCHHIFITYGSSYYYIYNKNEHIVSNCHKIPATEFTLDRLSVKQVQEYVAKTVELIQTINFNCRIIFTISPVRYLKYGLTGNFQSKAALIMGIDEIIKSNHSCHYFPAYEIVTDDLRDYRFYDSDLVQPNAQALQYIWEIMRKSMLSENCQKILKEIEPVLKARDHRPFSQNSKEHQKFLRKQLDLVNILSKSLPHIDWQDDIRHFKSKLNQ
jgi:hypothetical protein